MATITKTEVALTKSDEIYRIIIRSEDRKVLNKFDFKSKKQAESVYDDLCGTEKYRVIQLNYFDKHGAMRTLKELKV